MSKLYNNLGKHIPSLTTCHDLVRSSAAPNAITALYTRHYRTMPIIVRLIQFYAATKGYGIRFIEPDTIDRNSNTVWKVKRLFEYAANQDAAPEQTYQKFLRIVVVPIVGNITTTFDTAIPALLAENPDMPEWLNMSLALKLSARHRVRVYKKDDTFYIYSANYGITKNAETNDWLFARKIIACLPLMLDVSDSDPDFTALCRAHTTDDEIFVAQLYENYFQTIDYIKNATYNTAVELFRSMAKDRADALTKRIGVLESDIKHLLEQYKSYLEAQQQFRLQVNALTANDNLILSDDSIKLLVDNKIAYAFKRHDTNLFSYLCKAPCINFDKSAAKVYYANVCRRNDDQTYANFFKALFIDQIITIHFTERIVINTQENVVRARRDGAYIDTDLHNSIPNPHHYYYNCWGSYGAVITKLLTEGKYEELFYQIKTAAASLNMTDYTVLGRFQDHLNAYVFSPNSTNACFSWAEERHQHMHTFIETYNKYFKEVVTNETDSTD